MKPTLSFPRGNNRAHWVNTPRQRTAVLFLLQLLLVLLFLPHLLAARTHWVNTPRRKTAVLFLQLLLLVLLVGPLLLVVRARWVNTPRRKTIADLLLLVLVGMPALLQPPPFQMRSFLGLAQLRVNVRPPRGQLLHPAHRVVVLRPMHPPLLKARRRRIPIPFCCHPHRPLPQHRR